MKRVLIRLNQEYVPSEAVKIDEDYVWTMWLQDDIPVSIQACLVTIKKYYPNVVIITERNLSDFVNVPDYIYEKYKKGIISPPHFSDYVRTCLLEKYGGIWLDASCYMFAPIPKYILKQPFFILQGENLKTVSNFFICSTKGHYFISAIKIFLEEYWKDENTAIDYFFYHRICLILVNNNAICRAIWYSIIPDMNTKIKFLSTISHLDFDEDLWEYMSKTSYMYKLNWKNYLANKNEKSFLNYVIKQYLDSKITEKDV